MLRVHVETSADAELSTTLDELVAEGASRMLAAALEAEVDAYVSALADEQDDQGHRLVVRNGHAVARSLVTGAGPIEVRAPRVDDRRVDESTGEKMRFRSSILPPWARKSPKVAEVLPLMYLHGMSSGDFVPALEEFFGPPSGRVGRPAGRTVHRGWPEARRGPRSHRPYRVRPSGVRRPHRALVRRSSRRTATIDTGGPTLPLPPPG
jgi:hypothetical protein